MNRIPLENYLKAIPKLKSGLQKDGASKVELELNLMSSTNYFKKIKL
jgi:hypothetical protein